MRASFGSQKMLLQRAGRVSSRGIMFASKSPIQVSALEPGVHVQCSIHSSLEGRGLGLAVVDKILREHGAKMSVVSAPGRARPFTLGSRLSKNSETTQQHGYRA
jgi:signal transduction histidine kinase